MSYNPGGRIGVRLVTFRNLLLGYRLQRSPILFLKLPE
jgi:hypothetical protein